MSEFIGSRISLISKSEIRYIGTLDDINGDTHTVALIDVTSYGTEGRRPGNEMAGSDHVFEYIVFRGSDVKNLEIVAPPSAGKKENDAPSVPDDPAILGVSSIPFH
jgi:protein LSM14